MDRHHSYQLKHTAEELSVSGALYFDYEEFSEGRIVFDEQSALGAIQWQLPQLINVDRWVYAQSDEDPNFSCYVYFFDDRDFYTVYLAEKTEAGVLSEFVLVESEPRIPEFNSQVAFLRTGFIENVSSPTVVVQIGGNMARKGLFRGDAKIVRTSAHSWQRP